MATLKSIRTRITSVKNTQKITKAMKMVAAAKLRRAQMAVESSRPYTENLKAVMDQLVSGVEVEKYPLFKTKENPKKICMLLFTSNRGLCGGFNSNLLKATERFIASKKDQYEEIDLEIVGKKGRDFYQSRGRDLKEVHIDFADHLPFAEAEQIGQNMLKGYVEGEYDGYFLVYNEFKTALSQIVRIDQLVPFASDGENEVESDNQVESIYEPNKEAILEDLIPKFLATQIYRAHLESQASELGSRMAAMDSATKNASDMISKLTLQYNRLRQAAITTELMDIVNGAESIK